MHKTPSPALKQLIPPAPVAHWVTARGSIRSPFKRQPAMPRLGVMIPTSHGVFHFCDGLN